MRLSSQSIYAAWLTAKRAGLKRTFFRLQRRLKLKVINPMLADRMYAIPDSISVHPKRWSRESEFHQRIIYLADMHQLGHTKDAWDVEQKTLVLLNQAPTDLQVPVAWQQNPIGDPLWLFHLHGWEWAWAKLTNQHDLEDVAALWQDWLTNVPIGRTFAWEPYPASRRLAVWVAAWQLMEVGERFTGSIAQHADYLAHHLERDLDNNHLVANAKALVWAGLALMEMPNAAHWLDVGSHWLWQCIRTQVRGDGGHVENSTSYHLAVWLDALSTIYLCQACDVAVPDDIYDTVCRMGEFAWSLMLPNGRFPLLNDSIQDEPLPAQQIFDLAQKVLESTPYEMQLVSPRQSQVFPQTGMAVFHLDDEKTYLLFDAGDIGPSYCPGHGHADTLSIELWSHGQPLIVDPGTYQYPAGEWRDYFRSTAVHSTATVDGYDQTEFAGAFRVGRIAHGQLTSHDIDSSIKRVSGRHDGYKRLADPVLHQRSIVAKSATEIVIIDEFDGQDQHHLSLNFHLATEDVNIISPIEVEATYQNNIQLRISTNSIATGKYKKERSWLSSVWYKKIPTSIVSFQSETKLPVKLETTIKISVKE